MSPRARKARREKVLALVKKHAQFFKFASKAMQNDQEVALAAVQKTGDLLSYASADLQDDREVVLAAVRNFGEALDYASATLQADREVVLAAVRQNGLALDFASAALQNDREVVLAAVQNKAFALRYASEGLRNDEAVVLVAVQADGRVLLYASDTIKNNRKVVLAAIQNTAHAFAFASPILQNDENDKALVLAAVQKEGYLLSYAVAFQNDREVVLAAVRNGGRALEYASANMRNDREVVLSAVKQNGDLLRYASEDLRNDLEVVLTAVRNDGGALQHISADMRNDRAVILTAAENFEEALEFASADLRNNKEVVLAAVRNFGRALRFASIDLQNNKDVILAAVQRTPSVYCTLIPPNMKADKDVFTMFLTNIDQIQRIEFAGMRWSLRVDPDYFHSGDTLLTPEVYDVVIADAYDEEKWGMTAPKVTVHGKEYYKMNAYGHDDLLFDMNGKLAGTLYDENKIRYDIIKNVPTYVTALRVLASRAQTSIRWSNVMIDCLSNVKKEQDRILLEASVETRGKRKDLDERSHDCQLYLKSPVAFFITEQLLKLNNQDEEVLDEPAQQIHDAILETHTKCIKLIHVDPLLSEEGTTTSTRRDMKRQRFMDESMQVEGTSMSRAEGMIDKLNRLMHER